MSVRPFQQVDVFASGVLVSGEFASGHLTGNPVAVVFGADDLGDDQMRQFARWTNLSETTFICTPQDPAADYLLRIFTPGGELPFAGHPTLGSAHAWLRAGGEAKGENIIQECGVGLIGIRHEHDALAFAAPPLIRSGEVDAADLDVVRGALGLRQSDVVAANWVDNGPGWLGLLLTSGRRVLDIEPDFAALGDFKVGVIGPYIGDTGPHDRPDYEVRAFAPSLGVPEDPVTGSLNAGIACWLRGQEIAPASYVAAQGTALGRAGRVIITDDTTDIWVGGRSTTVITGEVDL